MLLRFPKDEERRKLWVKVVRRENWFPTNANKLCAAHFEKNMIDRTSLSCVRLREGAIPTIFTSFPSCFQKVSQSFKHFIFKIA